MSLSPFRASAVAIAWTVLSPFHFQTATAQVQAPDANYLSLLARSTPIGGLAVETFRKNQPVSFTFVGTLIQKLPDGTTINHSGKTKVYRDSEGRQRMESFYDNGQLMSVMLMDPIAGKVTFLNVAGKQAYVFKSESSHLMAALETLNAPTPSPQAIAQARSFATAGMVLEALPAKMINGLSSEGIRRTRTYAVGVVGNDKPITSVSEFWFSQQLGIQTERLIDDPRDGLSTTTATDVVQGEPDAALFLVPADYKLTEQ